MRDNRRYEREVLRYVETELYAYPWIEKEIEVLRSEILDSSPERAEVPSKSLGDPTFSKTVKLLSSKRLKKLTENYEAITRVLNVLPPEQLEFVRLKYWQREYTDYGIWQRLHISRRTYYRWREQILWAIAVELGLL